MATSLSLLKSGLKTTLIEGLYNEIVTNANNYYYFLGKTLEWTGGSTSVEIPENTLVAEADTRKEIVFVKKITSADIAFTVPRYDWVSGEVYDMYDDAIGATYSVNATATSANFSFLTGTFDLSQFGQGWLVTGTGIATGTFVDESTTTQLKLTKLTTGPVSNVTITKLATSGATTIEAAKFYVLTENQNVYKCLDNNNGAPSTVQPYSTTHEAIETADGYVWKFMYTIPNALVNKFVSLTDIPVTTAVRSAYYSRGALNAIQILDPGSGYQPGDELIVTGNGSETENIYKVLSVNIESPGSGYVSAPTITFSSPFPAVPYVIGDQYLAGQYVSVGNRIYLAEVAGVGTSNPTHTSSVAVANGTTSFKFVGLLAQGTASITSGGVSSVSLTGIIGNINIDDVGRGYDPLNPPVVTITGNGTNATAVAVVSNDGYVQDVVLTNRGSGYTTVSVAIDPPPTNVKTFAGTDTAVISVANNTFTFTSHGFTTGDRVVYDKGVTGNTAVGGLTDDVKYYVVVTGLNTFKLATTLANAVNNVTIDITALGTGTGHTISADVAAASVIGEIYYGYGYHEVPTISVAAPFTANVQWPSVVTTQWLENNLVDQNDILQVGRRFYRVTSAGANQMLINQQPTHLSGTVTIGVVALEFIGETAALTSFTDRSKAKLAPIIDNGQIIGVIVKDPGVGYTIAEITPATATGEGAIIEANLAPGDLNTRQANTELLATPGTINAIEVLHPGLDYTFANITIDGDGEGCEAEAVIESGAITKINIINPGFGYTRATVTITGNGAAVQAYARPIVSPIAGHGKDAVKELFAKDISLSSTIALDRNQGFVVDNEYRQLGIIKNPTFYNSTQRYVGFTGSTCFSVSGSFGSGGGVDLDEVLTDLDGNKFQVVAKNEANTTLLIQAVDNIAPVVGGVLRYNNNANQTTLTRVVAPTVDKYSGEMLFIDNRSAFQPTAEQTVSIKTVIRL